MLKTVSNLLNANNSLLLVIDVQERLLSAQLEAEKILKKALILAEAAKILEIPVVVTEQYPKGLGHTAEELKQKLGEGTKIFEKTSFSALQEEGFLEVLKSYGKNQIIICGLETHVCVLQSANELLKEGYEVHLVQDAVGSRAKFEHKIGLERMISDGAIPTCTETVLFELLRDAKTPNFKAVQFLIK